MKAHLIDTHLLLPRSRSCAKVKVKYNGHVSQMMGVSGALEFHKHILFSPKCWFLAVLFFPLCDFKDLLQRILKVLKQAAFENIV